MGKPRFTKIYTRTGDKGQTGLVGGKRVPKDDLRVECYGTVDELNSCIGVVRSFARDLPPAAPLRKEIDFVLEKIQQELFAVAGNLATPEEGQAGKIHIIDQDHICFWEKTMDVWMSQLPPAGGFVLPGGNKICAFLHLARTICRRAERLCVRLERQAKIHDSVVPYLNRLGDTLFVLARWAAFQSNESEPVWKRP